MKRLLFFIIFLHVVKKDQLRALSRYFLLLSRRLSRSINFARRRRRPLSLVQVQAGYSLALASSSYISLVARLVDTLQLDDGINVNQ